jgi:hypothetical protein
MAYIGQEPGQGQAERYIFTASGGETVVSADDSGLSLGYTENQVSVYLNGVKLVVGTDCIATNGSTITGLSALSASDVVEVIALSAFSPSDTVSASGGTFSGAVTASAGVVGNLTGNASGTAATVTTAAQPAITSVGTLTGLTATGDVTVSTGNLVIGTAGKGITFSSTNTPAQSSGTGTHNTLDDYEEGTWTPVLASTAGTIGSYTSSGTYTKTGRIVSTTAIFQITAVGSGSGGTWISGYPFSASATSSLSGAFREDSETGIGYVASGNGVTTTYINKYDAGTFVVLDYAGTLNITYNT